VLLWIMTFTNHSKTEGKVTHALTSSAVPTRHLRIVASDRKSRI
jgi:hypothetical protein